MIKDKISLGIAGELLVASKLSELSLIVGVTRKNTQNVDILVSDGINTRNIQVKTTRQGQQWVCPRPKIVHNNFIYIFVNMNKETTSIPEFHIVPSETVNKIMKIGYDQWNKKYFERHGHYYDESKGGVSHFEDYELKYKDKWNNLKLII